MPYAPSNLLRNTREFVGRSLFPLATCCLLWGVLVFGPWGLLLLTSIWWRTVTRIA
ncbi:MAG: hypothetical protein AB8H80_19435 [Planctomycetota bacterium]